MHANTLPETVVRICVCGDEGTGKTSLIVRATRDTFVAGRITPVIPPLSLPRNIGDVKLTPTDIIDTSARPQDRDTLRNEIRKCNVILLVYADNFTYDRLSAFWMPYFRSLGVNVPVVLCAAKADARDNEDEFFEESSMLMGEFRELVSSICTSAKTGLNTSEVIYMCQKAVIDPLAPLYDWKSATLKPACVDALKRIFYLSDKDQDGLLSDVELAELHCKCEGEQMGVQHLEPIKKMIKNLLPTAPLDRGVDITGFLALNRAYATMARQEAIWQILRTFHYTDSLSLEESFLHPKLDVPAYSSVELSEKGYGFFAHQFILFDKDNDGGLNDAELEALFSPTPGLPKLWVETSLPCDTVRNESGHITLEGWLALWSMTTFLEPRTTLEYLAYLGFDPNPDSSGGGGPVKKAAIKGKSKADKSLSITCALKITKPRRRRRRAAPVDRNVAFCYVVGASGAGKSCLLDAHLGRPFRTDTSGRNTHRPTLQPRRAVNSVELPGGKQTYLILEELPAGLETAYLDNRARLDACDMICYAYDSSDPDSFAHIVDLRSRIPMLMDVPAVFAALKADRDKATQRCEIQPDVYATLLGLNPPLHVSVNWNSTAELFVALTEAAKDPDRALPRKGRGRHGGGSGSGGVSAGVGASSGGDAGIGAGDTRGRFLGGLLGEWDDDDESNVGFYLTVGLSTVGVGIFGLLLWRRVWR